MGPGYDVLLVLHLLCVIGGFGYLAYSGLVLVLGRRRGASLGTLEVTQQVGTLAEMLIYGAFVFGIAAVGSSHRWHFGDTWVWVSIVLFVVAVGLLHGVIRRSQREYAALANRVAASSGPVASDDPQVVRIERLERRLVAGWGAFNLFVVAVVALMVVRPGG
ncbi:MAG TPA: DUF2269 family protein [Acidimicrobiales bacterium]|nr:DUF2269 family protein [Acidimicrobiales bacterium]